ALAQWMRRVCVTPGWAGAGIPLNAIAPGVVRTPMTAPLFADEAMVQVMNEAVPMPLNGHAGPEVIAEALRWLLSPANTHMTGQVVYVDGGAEATLRGAGLFCARRRRRPASAPGCPGARVSGGISTRWSRRCRARRRCRRRRCWSGRGPRSRG